jgi:hypothetical protein
MNRLIEVTVDFHLERGDRQALIIERQSLMQSARDHNLIATEESHKPRD